jgi:hypothetical protein
MATPTERLHRANDEPRSGPVEVAQKPARAMLWPWYLLLLLLIVAVGAGAWWLNTGREAAPSELPVEQSLPIAPARPQAADIEPIADATFKDVEQPAEALSQEPVRRESLRIRPAELPGTQPVRVREAIRATRRELSATDPVAAAAPVAGPTPIVVYLPQPNRGRVVQLGAFPTRNQAEETWKRITRAYPYLRTKSKMVNTVDVRGLGGGRPTRMYRLQLGTSSQAQSAVICQQLDRAGYSCVVVY